MNDEKIIKLLEQIVIRLDILTKKESIPQIITQKNLSFLFDKLNSNWTSFKPLNLNNMRLFGYYYKDDPAPSLSENNEGWIPLRVDGDGKLKVNAT